MDLRDQRNHRSPRHLFIDADLVAECRWNVDVAAVTRCSTAQSGNRNRRDDFDLSCVLYWSASAGGPQLRRHDKRLSLDVLVHTALACNDDSGGRSARPNHERAGARGCLIILFSAVRQLSHMESLGSAMAI